MTELPAVHRRAILDVSNEVYVSAALAWEIVMRRGLGRLDFEGRVCDAVAEEGFVPLAVELHHADEVARLPTHHRDPFDRLLIAQARLESLTMLTRDALVRAYPGLATGGLGVVPQTNNFPRLPFEAMLVRSIDGGVMRRRFYPFVLTALVAAGCSCNEESGDSDGSTTGMDGGTSGADGGTSGTDGGTTGMDARVVLPDGRVVAPPVEVTCQGHLYACGNTLDDDEDGLADSRDPDCLGPCDNNEAGFYLMIPGGDAQPCRLDCYFDQDEGPGNDMCRWDHRCDPLEPDLNPLCQCAAPPCRGGSRLVNGCCAPPDATCPDPQDPVCADLCLPLVPNGCDCFGCCNLPAGTDRWVFIGSVDASGTPTCTLDDVSDDARCHRCTPVENCINRCGRCELCLGRTFEDLPADCFMTPVDAGTYPDGGAIPPPDGGTTVDVCEDPDRQDCGAPGLPACPDGYFCLTGCCTFFG